MLKYYLIHTLNEISEKIQAKKVYPLPHKLVEDCITYYENHDIFLIQDQKYLSEKISLLEKNNITHADFQKFINATRNSSTTYFIYDRSNIFDKIINKLLSKDNTKKCEQIPANTIYIDLDLYKKNAAKKFKQKILKNKSKSQIIIDLRKKPGGYVQECIKICEMLLPKGPIFSQKYKDKFKIHFSSASQLKFNKITVLVDSYTASSCEILFQSLEKNLTNCTVIGSETAGKHIGQDHFTNKKYHFIFSVSSFTWEIIK